MTVRLTRNWLIGVAAVGASVGLGAVIASEGGGKATAWGLFMAVLGAAAFGQLLVPWSADGVGLARAGRRWLSWSEVTAVEVLAYRTSRGQGPPRVNVVLKGSDRRAVLNIYSRHDAELLHAVLVQHLPADVEGRALLWLIPHAWTAMD